MDIDIGINKANRQAIADQLAVVLADTYVLYFKTHGYHWNVTGPQFPALHELFEEQYKDLWLAVDAIAERIRALGVQAPASASELAKRANIKEADGAPPAAEMVADLARGHERVTKSAREAFSVAEGADDQPTMDLMIDRMKYSEKAAWMLRATVG